MTPGPPLYLRIKWHLGPSSRLATTDMARKLRVGCAPFVGGAGFPSYTMWPGPRPTSMPNGILIHPTVCRQYTNVTDSRQDRQTDRHTDNSMITQGEPFYKTVAKNCKQSIVALVIKLCLPINGRVGWAHVSVRWVGFVSCWLDWVKKK